MPLLEQKPPNKESVACKDFEQLRRGDWLMRLTRNEISVFGRFPKITPIEFTTKPIRRGSIDYNRIENIPPLEFSARPMGKGNIDNSSSDRITPLEFGTKPIRKGNSDFSGCDRITKSELRTKMMRKGNSDYSGSDRIPRLEFRTKPMRKDDADWKFTDKMMLFDATTGSKNYTICKILVSNILPTDGGQPSNLYTSNSGFRMSSNI